MSAPPVELPLVEPPLPPLLSIEPPLLGFWLPAESVPAAAPKEPLTFPVAPLASPSLENSWPPFGLEQASAVRNVSDKPIQMAQVTLMREPN